MSRNSAHQRHRAEGTVMTANTTPEARLTGTRQRRSAHFAEFRGSRLVSLIATGFIVAICLTYNPALAADPVLSKEVTFDIAPQPLDSALLEFSKQAGVQVMLAAHSIGHQTTQGLKGKLVVSTALAALLRDTGLAYRADGN